MFSLAGSGSALLVRTRATRNAIISDGINNGNGCRSRGMYHNVEILGERP
jgi:hypothetical protein